MVNWMNTATILRLAPEASLCLNAATSTGDVVRFNRNPSTNTLIPLYPNVIHTNATDVGAGGCWWWSVATPETVKQTSAFRRHEAVEAADGSRWLITAFWENEWKENMRRPTGFTHTCTRAHTPFSLTVQVYILIPFSYLLCSRITVTAPVLQY